MKDGVSKERVLEIAGYQYPAEQMDAYTVPREFQEISDPKKLHAFVDWDGEYC